MFVSSKVWKGNQKSYFEEGQQFSGQKKNKTKGQIMMCKIIQRTSLLNSSRKNIVLQFEISLKKNTIIFAMYNSPYRLMICRVLYQTKFYDKQKTIWKLKPQIIGPEKDYIDI
jgi:hypothetical protein